jgi:putative glutathione S-transferase
MGGYLERGRWVESDDWDTNENGAFERRSAVFRQQIVADQTARFAAEAGRYHLFASFACPWSQRALLIRALKGLERAVTVSMTNPVMGRAGWTFGETPGVPEPEPRLHKRHLYEVYLLADPDYSGRVTVPVLWDLKHGTIVNNESREILRMFDLEFDRWATRPISLRPNHLAETVDATIDALYAPVNDGVYRAGFANGQTAYEEAFERLFAALDHWDGVLARQRYLCGPTLTEADLCMFVTLLRFDPVYYLHFKCNRRRIEDYRHLAAYLRELYQLPHVAGVCRFDEIKQHYYRSHPGLNPKGIVPKGPDLAWLLEAHGRGHLPGGPPPGLREAA